MALFKILRGPSDNLKNLSLKDGYCYFTPDTGLFYIDYQKDSMTETKRIPLNAGGIIDQNTGEVIKLWYGSTAEYEAIQTKDESTIYLLSDGESDSIVATDIAYDNSVSKLFATDIQNAIDEIATTAGKAGYVLETNKGLQQKFWRGTKEEYDALVTKDEDTMYIILDEDGENVIESGADAEDIIYNNTTSGLIATNVQNAIDELVTSKSNVTNLENGSKNGSLMNIGATASDGLYGFAEGYASTVNGDYGHAEGWTTIAGYASHAEGASTIASGGFAHAEGSQTIASGPYSHAEGLMTIASGKSSHAEGGNTNSETGATSTGGRSVSSSNIPNTTESILIKSTTAQGINSHAEGYYSFAYGNESHAEGTLTVASGKNSHAEGYGAVAFGKTSHAEGGSTRAEGENSHAEGYLTEAIGIYSHAENSRSVASGEGAHSEGYQSTASGKYSHAEGYYANASGDYSHAQGKANIIDNSLAHVVGNGTPGTRSNAHTLDWEGNAWFAGDVYVGSTGGKNKDEGSKKLVTVDEMNAAIAAAIEAAFANIARAENTSF